MSKTTDYDDNERMTVRNSLLVWVSGAVIGWVVAVMVIYSALRAPDEPMMAEDNRQNPPALADEITPDMLNEIAPAAGSDLKVAPTRAPELDKANPR